MAGAIEMRFGLRTQVGPRNHGVQITHGKGEFWEGNGRTTAVQKRLNRLRCSLGCGLAWAQGIVC